MSLPAGVSTFELLFGKTFDFEGTPLRTDLVITPSHELVWEATGDRLVPIKVSKDANEGEYGSVNLPHTDQAGFVNLKGEAIIDWWYTVQSTDRKGRTAASGPKTRKLQATSDQLTIDLDLVPTDGSVGPVGSAVLPAVTSVNGETGAVTVAGATDGGVAALIVDDESDTFGAVDAAAATLLTTPGTALNLASTATIAESVSAGIVDPETDIGAATLAVIAAESVSLSRLSIMPALAAADIAAASSSQRVALESAATFTDAFANLSAWTTTSLAVSGGKVHYPGSGTDVRIAAPWPLGTTGKGRFRTTITLPAPSGAANYLTIGVLANGQAAVTAGGAAASSNNFVGVGFDTSTNQAVRSLGASVGNSTVVIDTTAPPVGDINVTCVVDELWIAFMMVSADGTWSAGWRWERSVLGGVNNILHRNQDLRTTAGGKLGAIQARTNIVSVSGDTVQGAMSSAAGTTSPVSRTIVLTPPGYDSRRTYPVVMYCHGSGGSGASLMAPPFGGSAVGGVVGQAIANAGYILVAGDGDGTQEWGNTAGLAKHVDSYRYARDHYALGPTVVIGGSMGGLASLRLIAEGMIPAVGWAGISPVLSLANIYADNATFRGYIKTAWGIASDGSDYDAKTAGGDPMLIPTWKFRGLPMLIRTNATDSTVNPARHSDLFAARVANSQKEFTLEVEPGSGHTGADVWDIADLGPFLRRCVAT
jgi:acetyl esterase/lipase